MAWPDLTEYHEAVQYPARAFSDPTLQKSKLELDRFGFVAQVLATRYGCTAERCDALAMFRDPSRIQANLAAHTFDGLVERHAAAWSAPRQPSPVPVAQAPEPPRRFTRLVLTVRVAGPGEDVEKKIRGAVDLSRDRYCCVFH